MMSEVYLQQLQAVAENADTSDDALIYACSATWEMWQNHVPQIVRSMWPLFGEDARLAIYLTARAVTLYDIDSKDDALASRVERLEAALRNIEQMTDNDNPDSYRCDDREGCLDACCSAARDALENDPRYKTEEV